MHFMNKHHKVSFSYYFKFDRIMCVLVTFQERGNFAMPIIKSLHSLSCISGHMCNSLVKCLFLDSIPVYIRYEARSCP